VIVVGAAGWPLSIRAVQPAQAPLIGVLFAARADDAFSKWFTTAFARLMKERGSLSGPLDKKRLGVVPYLAVKYPSVFSLLLVICVVVLAVTLLEAIQEWRFSSDKALHDEP
jgi:hypothetical protein